MDEWMDGFSDIKWSIWLKFVLSHINGFLSGSIRCHKSFTLATLVACSTCWGRSTIFPKSFFHWSHAVPLFSSDKCLCCEKLSDSCADELALQLQGSRGANGPLPPLFPVTKDTVCAINNTKLSSLSLDTLAPLLIKSWKQILSSSESPGLTWDWPIKPLGSRAGNHGIPVHNGSRGEITLLRREIHWLEFTFS